MLDQTDGEQRESRRLQRKIEHQATDDSGLDGASRALAAAVQIDEGPQERHRELPFLEADCGGKGQRMEDGEDNGAGDLEPPIVAMSACAACDFARRLALWRRNTLAWAAA